MGKYTYTRVEGLSDLDITGNTQYYLYEESVGHEPFEKEKMKKCSLYVLERYIADRIIFTREMKPWYERIPKHGVLCRYEGGVSEGLIKGACLLIIKEYDDTEHYVYSDQDTWYDIHSVVPLTNQEIKQFLREED